MLQVNNVRTWITTTVEHTKEMRRLQSNILSSPRPDECMSCHILSNARTQISNLCSLNLSGENRDGGQDGSHKDDFGPDPSGYER